MNNQLREEAKPENAEVSTISDIIMVELIRSASKLCENTPKKFKYCLETVIEAYQSGGDGNYKRDI